MKRLSGRRALLASALTWATVDSVVAHFGQISAEQMQAVQSAIASFEPIENVLETIQQEKASFEATNNTAVALQLAGEAERGCRIALRGLQRHPLAEGLLRIRINELDDKDDVSAIRALTDSRLNDLPTDVLIILAEVSANRGELEWYRHVQSVLDTRNVDERKASDLLALSVHATWMSGKHTEAVAVAQAQLAVQLRYQHDVRWVAVEEPGLPQLVTWPEVVRPDSDQAISVAEKKVGEKAQLDTGFGKVEAEIVQIESILLFAARKAQEVIAATAVPSGPLWSVNLGKQDGELDIEPILESLRRRAKHVEGLFAQYSMQRFPISTLADALGTDPVTLLLEWPYKHASLFVSNGTKEEREQGQDLLRHEGLRYVLDLVTLAELVRWEVFEKALKAIGTPLVPQTLKEKLLGLIQLVDTPRATANMREESGQFYMTDIPAEYYEQRKQWRCTGFCVNGFSV